ncbi:flavodoxin family protein [Candidatus Lokiarchaeum ossiferum]|uniref:flavodoxin family protein n=1 Tax=Candidatus Lokiarchaeum ossiferum TaxID=2951803 RepID=UPI00352CD403
MKILAIISSPRKKNTYQAIKTIESMHKKRYDCEYEYLFLHKVDLKGCIGCHLCLTEGEDSCPLKDDRDMIISKIEAADGVILASPNHTMNVNWRMKNFIDRFSYLMHRPRYFNQRFMILITSGSYQGIKGALKALAPMVSGGKIISKFAVTNSPGMNDKKRKKQAKKLQKEARKFIKEMKKPFIHNPPFGYLIWFSVFKAMTKETGKDSPADFEYYSTKEYFVKTDLSKGQRLILKIFIAIFGFLIRIGMI